MFRTYESDIAGVPGMFGEGLAHWHHVYLKIRHEDRMISSVQMLNDESKWRQMSPS
ncbi:hypothetical protein J2Y56_001971 [Pseudomonas sp. BE134]|nr:hypothetical protein [Pseudomonas sp. BE134]